MVTHPWCSSNPVGWVGHGHTLENPAKACYDYDYKLPDGQVIPAGTSHIQWETLNFGWWKWMDNSGNLQIAKY